MATDSGEKTGGRQKGTPNKRTLALEELLDEAGHDPVMELIEVSRECDLRFQKAVEKAEEEGKLIPNGAAFWLELKKEVNKELLPYKYAKRKAIELKTGEEDKKPAITLNYKIDPKEGS